MNVLFSQKCVSLSKHIPADLLDKKRGTEKTQTMNERVEPSIDLLVNQLVVNFRMVMSVMKADVYIL